MADTKSKSSSSGSSSKSSSSSSSSSKKSDTDPRTAKGVFPTIAIDDTTVSGDDAALHGHYATVTEGKDSGFRGVVIAATHDDDGNVKNVVLRDNAAPLATLVVPYKNVKRDYRLGV